MKSKYPHAFWDSSALVQMALSNLGTFRSHWREILPVDMVRDVAKDCNDRYRIRSADALQLAAALVWSRQSPRRRPFICFDVQLGEAARQAGFEVHSA